MPRKRKLDKSPSVARNPAAAPTDNNLSLPVKKSLDECFVSVCGKQISIPDVCKNIRAKLADVDVLEFNPGNFFVENEELISSIFQLHIYDRPKMLSIDELCFLCSENKSICSKLKGLFKYTYRKQLTEPDEEPFSELKIEINNSVKLLEPGENVESLWNEDIAAKFEQLVSTKYKFIKSFISNTDFQVVWLKKFIDNVLMGRKMWPKGMMSNEFLYGKASDMLTIETIIVSPKKVVMRGKGVLYSKSPTKYRDQDCPKLSAMVAEVNKVDNYSSNLALFEQMYCIKVPAKASSSRRHSNESVVEVKTGVSTSRRKRRSNESSREVESKRQKISHSPFQSHGMTEYDQKLQGFKVWDALKSKNKRKTKPDECQKHQIFPTKKEVPKESAYNMSGLMAGSVSKALAGIAVAGEPGTGVTNVIRRKIRHITIDPLKKKADVLKEVYGMFSVDERSCLGNTHTVVISIQEYFFEGAAESEEGAIENACSKILLLAPYLLEELGLEK